MTKPNTISNLLGFIGLVLLLALGIMFLYNAVKLWVGKSEYESIKDKEWKEHIMKQMEMMQEMHKQNEHIKKKSNPKQFDGVGSDKFFVKTRKKSVTKKTK
jgi:predicted Holliday junction resolvase-like endonuclease